MKLQITENKIDGQREDKPMDMLKKVPVREQDPKVRAWNFEEVCYGYNAEEEKEEVKEQVKTFKKHYKLFQFGDYYRISSPFENNDFTAWEYADREGKEACLSVVYTDLHGNPAPHVVKLKGLCREKNYEVSRDGEPLGEFSGAALMNGGLLLPIPKENYDSCQFYVCAK